MNALRRPQLTTVANEEEHVPCDCIAAGVLAPALLLTTPSFAATAAPTAVTVPAVSSSADEPDADA